MQGCCGNAMGEGQAEARLKRDAEEAAAAEAEAAEEEEAAEEAEAEAAEEAAEAAEEAAAANVSTLWRRPALFRDNNTTESRLKKERLEGARPPLWRRRINTTESRLKKERLEGARRGQTQPGIGCKNKCARGFSRWRCGGTQAAGPLVLRLKKPLSALKNAPMTAGRFISVPHP